MESKLPGRKSTRLKSFDYSTTGAYFITICTHNRKNILSRIVRTENREIIDLSVGEGLAPPEYRSELKPCGMIADEQLKLIENRYPSVTIEDYVIMPNHIHIIIYLHEEAGGASPSPTLDDVVCAFKSLTSRICKQRLGVDKMFQRSYADHIIRNYDDYEKHVKYIHDNPMRWYYDELYSE